MSELVCEDSWDGGFVFYAVREVPEDGVGVDVWILGRVDSREVMVFYEDLVVCRGQRSKGEGALEVLTGRRRVEVNRVGLKDVGAIDCRGEDFFNRVCGYGTVRRESYRW